MSMFPHTVTVYNTTERPNKETLEDETVHNITILRGVLLDASKGANVTRSGMEGADAVNLYIPFNVAAVDGVTGQQKPYIGPVEFWRMYDNSGYWTLSVNGSGGKTLFIKGEVVDLNATEEKLNMAYDDVYNVTKVDVKDFGGLKHFEVGGA